VLVIPANASYDWDNSINIEMDSMTWGYTEKYSGDRSVFIKKYIDMEIGNNDSFVSAWELLKADVEMSRSFRKSIENNMDVMIDNSSRNVILLEIESDLSSELIGVTDEQSSILNKYEVSYDFKIPLDESGSLIWFQGEPGTDVVIDLPAGMEMIYMNGIDNVSFSESPEGTVISGKFGFSGEVFIEYSIEEEEPVPVGESTEGNETTNVTKESSSPAKNTRIGDFLDRLFSGDTDDLLKKLKSGDSELL